MMITKSSESLLRLIISAVPVSKLSSGGSNIFVYADGDESDTIYYSQSGDRIQIATNNGCTSKKSVDDLIIKVCSGSMTFKDGVNTPFKIIAVSIPSDAFEYNGHSYYIYFDVADT